MTSTVERVAASLESAHRTGRALESMPAGGGPASREQAYAIQDRVAASLGATGGWKTGAPSPQAEPIAAPILAAGIVASPATLRASRFHDLGVEAEVAFRFAHAMPPRGRAYSRDEVADAIGSLVLAIEVVDSRLGAWARDEPLWKLADNQSNGGLVCGDEVRAWRDLDLLRFPVELWVDGVRIVPGDESANPAGDPLRLATWLVNHLAATRSGLAAGAVVTTGSYTGLRPARAGQTVTACYPGLGEVVVAFG